MRLEINRYIRKNTFVVVWLAVILLCFSGVFYLGYLADASTSILPYPKFKALDTNGAPLVGGKLYTYIPGTTTAKTTYSNRTLTSANTNPVILDSYGEATIYLDGLTKLVLKDSSDVTIWTMDSVGGAIEESGVSASPSGYIAVYTTAGTGVSGQQTISGASITPSTLPSNRLYQDVTVGLNSTSPVSTSSYNVGLIQVVEIGTTGPTTISGVSGQWYTGVSLAGRTPLAGVSILLASPSVAGQNAVIFLKHQTTNPKFGTTTYVLFAPGDVINGPDVLVAGTSKYQLSGVTDAQTLVLVSTSVSTWTVKASGSPSVVKQ